VIFGVSRLAGGPASRPSTFTALALAAAAALVGAVLWGLAALVFHRQLSLIGLLIGLGAGLAVARYRPGDRRTIVAGAVIAVVGCALGTFLAIVFSLLDDGVSLSAIMAHLSTVLRGYPGAVGWLGLLFWLVAAYAAVRVPLRARAAQSANPARDGPDSPADGQNPFSPGKSG
jgi:hypothetical protein